MGIAHDDGFIAWVNGKHVARNESRTGAILDNVTVDVDLKQGVNSILLKVDQGTSAWSAAVRLWPASVGQPLFEFKLLPGNKQDRLPVVNIDLLNARGKLIQRMRSNGIRGEWPGGGGGQHRVYAAKPAVDPSKVRFSINAPGLKLAESKSEFPWKQVLKNRIRLNLLATEPSRFLVIDATTQDPIVGAEVWEKNGGKIGMTDENGTVSIDEMNPMQDQCWVTAPGHLAAQVKMEWPRGGTNRVALVEGGRSIIGQVVSTDGTPLDRVLIDPNIYNGFDPDAVSTDDEGRFAIHGLSDDRTTIYPVIQRQGYVTKDRFSFRIGDAREVEVRWELEPAAFITGRVTDAEGEPIAGVTLTTGDDRFGSNNKNPSTTTDADGHYELYSVPPGQNLLHAFSNNHAPQMTTISVTSGAPTEANFILKPGQHVTGRIVDPNGNPISQVWLVTDTWKNVRMFRRETRTDDDGRFTLAHMPDDAVQTDILKQGYVSIRDRELRGGETLNLAMTQEVTHTINIRDTDGQVVPGLQISKGYLWSGNSEWHWSSNSYETTRYYTAHSGTMKITIDEPIHGEIAYRFRANGYRDELVPLPALSEGAKSFDVVLQPAEKFAGRVVDADTGQPLDGIGVALVRRGGDRFRPDHYVDFRSAWKVLNEEFTGPRAFTNTDGLFRLSKPADSTDSELVLVSKTGAFHHITGLDRAIANANDDAESISLELPFPKPCVIKGRLLVAGEPMGHSKIHLRWVSHGTGSGTSNQFGVGGQWTTDEEGRFHFADLGPGRYALSRVFRYERNDGGGMSAYLESETVDVLPGQTLIHDIKVPAGIAISGQILDDSDEPVAECVLTAYRNADARERVAMTVADGFGRFSFEHLQPGTYKIQAERSSATSYQLEYFGTLDVELTESVNDAVIRASRKETANSTDSAAVAQPSAQANSLTGTLAPDLTIRMPVDDGTSDIRLGEPGSPVTVLAFWSSWFGEPATLASAWEGIKNRQGSRFLVVFSGNADSAKQLKDKSGLDCPIIVESIDSGSPIRSTFGAQGNGECFVIGSDGRFAAEPTHISALSPLLASVMEKDITDTPAKTDTVTVRLLVDGEPNGLPNPKLEFTLSDSVGEPVETAKYALPGVGGVVSWRHARSTGGRLSVGLSGSLFDPQERIIEAPKSTESVEFNVRAPRRISGKVTQVGSTNAVAGMTLRFQNQPAGSYPVTTDANGEFSVSVFPGNYFLSNAKHEELALALKNDYLVVGVSHDVDPDPLALTASPAVTIKGKVVGTAGSPVPGATVASQLGQQATADENGEFALSGIASKGRTQIVAMANESYGAKRLTDPDSSTTCIVHLGQGLGDAAEESQTNVVAGSEIGTYRLSTLDGSTITWPEAEQSSQEGKRLTVIGALWHPATRTLIEAARQWHAEQNRPVDLICIDFSIEQARRHASQLDFPGRILYAGPYGFEPDAGSNLTPPTAVLVDLATRQVWPFDESSE